MLALISALAAAQDPVERDWQLADRRALTTFRVGEGMAIGGVGAATVGLAWGADGLYGLGSLSEAIALPMMAGASLRSRRALHEQGAVIPATGGAVAWTLWGLGLVAGGVAYGALADGDDRTYVNAGATALGLRIGGYVAAGIQGAANKRARYRLSLAPGK